MEKKEIGRFYGISFDSKIIEFIAYDDNTMSCPTLNIDTFVKIELKPRFRLWNGENRYYIYDVPSYHYGPSQLIAKYHINGDLFAYLKENGMIKYSNDMAYLYGFEDKCGYDNSKNGGVGSPYKWAKKKGAILTKQKNGDFNSKYM